MLDIIGRAFPSKYQTIFIKLIFSIFIIFLEISLSQIHFLYQKTPYFLYTFIYFWFLEIGLMSYWVYFFIGLFYDLIFGTNLGLSTISILLLVPILTLTHPHIKNFDYTKRFLSFAIFMTFLLSLKTTFFFIFYFKMPEIEFIIFQILITLIFYPLLFLFFSPASKLISLIVREQ